MRVFRRVLALGLLISPQLAAQGGALPASSLAVRDGQGAWQTIWRSGEASGRPSGAPLVSSISWRRGDAGTWWGEAELAGAGESWRTRLVVVRLDPTRVRLRLDSAFTTSRQPAWTIGRAPTSALVAVNAGQFESTIPWGWVRIAGRRWLPSQRGPLAPALLEDASGTLRWIPGDRVTEAASSLRGVQWAFQSYPALIQDDTVVAPLRARGLGVDVSHRDARLALCLARDGAVIVALTRFDALGTTLDFVPFGLTAPEMAGIMAALGCRNAMLLDGGISAQMLVRDGDGSVRQWRGARPVPLALVAEAVPP